MDYHYAFNCTTDLGVSAEDIGKPIDIHRLLDRSNEFSGMFAYVSINIPNDILQITFHSSLSDAQQISLEDILVDGLLRNCDPED